MPEQARENVADKINRKTSEAAHSRIDEGFTRPTVKPFNLVKSQRIGGGVLKKSINILVIHET